MARGIILGEDGAVVENGDFLIGEVDNQNLKTIIGLNPGNAKNDPLLFVSLSKNINAPAHNLNAVIKQIKLALKRDNVWEIAWVRAKSFDSVNINAQEI